MDATSSQAREHDWLGLLGAAADCPRTRSAALIRLARLAAAEHMAQAARRAAESQPAHGGSR